jgi:elongator complex protein 5
MMLYDYNSANIDWDAVTKTFHLVQHPLDESVRLPKCLVGFHEQRFTANLQEVATATKKKPSFQSGDRYSWIKTNNFNTHNARKRKRKPEARTFRTMAPLALAQYQRHSVHLMSRVLNIRTNASPFTLILDDLNQRAMPFVGEIVRRALSRNINVVIVSFEATRFHPAVRSISAHAESNGEHIMQNLRKVMTDAKESLVIIDSLYELLEVEGIDMSALFNLVAGKFASTLVGVYHQDMLPAQDTQNAYAPQPLDLLKYMATSVVTCKSFAHVLATKAAKERSLAEPTHGLLQGAEGIVQCLDANDHRGIVLEAEFRRKSGRPESEAYFLRTARQSDYNVPIAGMSYGTLKQEFVTLLDQVPAYGSQEVLGMVNASADEIESTFNLGLTDKQKQAREGVVLPYFDAQKGEGGEGGRILYDMGEEDDFDEEEDEI